MKFKNYEILDIREAFNRSTTSLTLPIAVAWKRRLNYEKILNVSRIIYEALDDVSKDFSDDEHSFEDPENNSMRRVREKYMKDFEKRKIEILDQETDVDIQMVNIEDLGDNLNINDNDMNTLAFMINK